MSKVYLFSGTTLLLATALGGFLIDILKLYVKRYEPNELRIFILRNSSKDGDGGGSLRYNNPGFPYNSTTSTDAAPALSEQSE